MLECEQRLQVERRHAEDRGKELAELRASHERVRLQLADAHSERERVEETQRNERAQAERVRERLETVEAEARAAVRDAMRDAREALKQRDVSVAEAARAREALGALQSEHGRLESSQAFAEQQSAALREEKVS